MSSPLPAKLTNDDFHYIGPQCFKAAEKPSYHSGIIAMLVGFILNLVFNQVLRYLYLIENRKRDKALEGKTEEEVEALREQSRIQGFENVTDKENVSFYLDKMLDYKE